MLPKLPRQTRFGHCFRDNAMNCAEFEVMLHALIDGELDAGHAPDVESHAAICSVCGQRLAAVRAIREAMGNVPLKQTAPAHLRSRIEAAVPAPTAQVIP